MGLLRVTAEDHAEITAHSARLHLLILGETFVLGNAALEQSREVRALAEGLRAAGVGDSLRVQGVRIASASGLLLKHQKAEFRLAADVAPTGLPAALGVIAAQKNVRIQRLEWQFDDFGASIGLSASAMQKARRKAEAIAGAAGLAVMGIEQVSDTWETPAQPLSFMEPEAALSRARAVAGPLDVGVDYSATQTVTVRLTVDFQIR